MKSVVLLSGGLDSTVNLYEAKEQGSVVKAITFDYGQRAARQEIQSAQKICKHLDIPHLVLSLPWFQDFTETALLKTSQQIPNDILIDDRAQSESSARAVWVPNRNGIFLNIGAAYAEGLGADCVVPGFNLEEGQTFPDNTQGFLDALSASFRFSTANHVQAKCFTTGLNKTEIVRRGRKLGVSFQWIWPCYLAEATTCGHCESCLRFRRAMKEA